MISQCGAGSDLSDSAKEQNRTEGCGWNKEISVWKQIIIFRNTQIFTKIVDPSMHVDYNYWLSLAQTRPHRTWVSRHVGGGEFVIFPVEGVIFGFFCGPLKDRIWSTCILCTHKVTMRVPSVPPTNLAGSVFYMLIFILFDILIMLVGNSQKYVSRCTKCISNSFILGESLMVY